MSLTIATIKQPQNMSPQDNFQGLVFFAFVGTLQTQQLQLLMFSAPRVKK